MNMSADTDTDTDTQTLTADERAAAVARGDMVEGEDDPNKTDTDTDSLGKGKLGEETDETETPEEKAEREKEEAAAEANKRIRIPKSRFDEAQAKARARETALVEEIARLKGGQQASTTQKAVTEMRSKIDELQDTYEDLLMDGKKDDAKKTRRELENLRDQLSDYTTTVKSDAARRAAVEELTYNAQLAGFEAKYPVLNPDNELFDGDLTTEVADLAQTLTKSGKTMAEALTKAVKYVLGAPPVIAPTGKAQQTAEDRVLAARKKAAEANKKQPADSTKTGLDSDKAGGGDATGIDVMRMSQKRFAKIDDETLSRLRGDEV